MGAVQTADIILEASQPGGQVQTAEIHLVLAPTHNGGVQTAEIIAAGQTFVDPRLLPGVQTAEIRCSTHFFGSGIAAVQVAEIRLLIESSPRNWQAKYPFGGAWKDFKDIRFPVDGIWRSIDSLH